VKSEPFFFATQRPYFFCSAKRNRRKKRLPHTTAFGYPALLINKGVCGTRYAQTVLDEIPFIDSVVPARGMSAKCPLFHSDLGAIGVAQGGLKPQKPTTVIPAKAGIHFEFKSKHSLTPTPLPPAGEGLTHLAGFDLKSPAAAPVMI
jgi:hypothetical protein